MLPFFHPLCVASYLFYYKLNTESDHEGWGRHKHLGFTIGYFISDALLAVLNGIIIRLRQSQPAKYSWAFNVVFHHILNITLCVFGYTTKKIPFGWNLSFQGQEMSSVFMSLYILIGALKPQSLLFTRFGIKQRKLRFIVYTFFAFVWIFARFAWMPKNLYNYYVYGGAMEILPTLVHYMLVAYYILHVVWLVAVVKKFFRLKNGLTKVG